MAGPLGAHLPGGCAVPSHSTPSTSNPRPLFDDKVAVTSEYKYSDARPEVRVKVVRNYLVGRCWELHVLLKWAEDAAENGSRPMRITPSVLEACRGNPQIGNVDMHRLSREMWSFLNLNIVGDGAKEARRIFDSVPTLDGMEVWRRIVGPLAPRTLHRQHDLYSSVHRPAQARSLAGVTAAIEVWELDLQKYTECGGVSPRDAEKIIIAMTILPGTTPASLLLSLRKAVQYDVWKREINEQLLFIKQHSGLGAVAGANLLDEEVNTETEAGQGNDGAQAAEEPCDILAMLTPEQQEELRLMPLAAQAEVLAFQKAQFRGRFAAKPKAKAKARAFGSGAGGRPGTPPRTGATGQTRCANCGLQGHPTSERKKARVEFKDRLCFKCGKPGHRQSDCPNPPFAGVVAPGPLPAQATAYALCVRTDDCDCEGFKTVERRHRP